MARPRPKPTFEGQLPPPERNPLALSVSALLHVVVILVVMLLSKRLAEQKDEKPKVDSAATREVAMVYVPPPKPKPVPPPPHAPAAGTDAAARAAAAEGDQQDAGTGAECAARGAAHPGQRPRPEQPRAPDPVGDPTASAPDATPPAPVNKEDALNASMEMEAKRIFGKKKGGVNPDAGPVAVAAAREPDDPRQQVSRDPAGLDRGAAGWRGEGTGGTAGDRAAPLGRAPADGGADLSHLRGR